MTEHDLIIDAWLLGAMFIFSLMLVLVAFDDWRGPRR